MRDILRMLPKGRLRPEAELTKPERAATPAPDPWEPINPRDGMPRLILTWVTTAAGSGFTVDTFNIATQQIATFYLDGGAAVASLTRQTEGEQIGAPTAQPTTEIPVRPASTPAGNESFRTGPTQPPHRPYPHIAARAATAKE